MTKFPNNNTKAELLSCLALFYEEAGTFKYKLHGNPSKPTNVKIYYSLTVEDNFFDKELQQIHKYFGFGRFQGRANQVNRKKPNYTFVVNYSDFHIFLPHLLNEYVDRETFKIKPYYKSTFEAHQALAFYYLIKNYHQFNVQSDPTVNKEPLSLLKTASKNPLAVIQKLESVEYKPAVKNFVHCLTLLFNNSEFGQDVIHCKPQFKYSNSCYQETADSMAEHLRKHVNLSEQQGDTFYWKEKTISRKSKTQGFPKQFIDDRFYQKKRSQLFAKVSTTPRLRSHTKRLAEQQGMPFFPVKKYVRFEVNGDKGVSRIIALFVRRLFVNEPFEISKRNARRLHGLKHQYFIMFYVGQVEQYKAREGSGNTPFGSRVQKINEYFCYIVYRLKQRPTREGCDPKHFKRMRPELTLNTQTLSEQEIADGKGDPVLNPDQRNYVKLFLFEQKNLETGELYVKPEHKSFMSQFQQYHPYQQEELQKIQKKSDSIRQKMLDDYYEDQYHKQQARQTGYDHLKERDIYMGIDYSQPLVRPKDDDDLY